MQAFEAPDWQKHTMGFEDPFPEFEPLEDEVRIIDDALAALVEAGVLPHADYDKNKMLAHRAAVRERFEIPWTGITPRMERLIYAVNAITQPRVMVAVGTFCGYTFTCNAGASVGPGACYAAERVVGIEIREEETERARRNVASIDAEGRAEVLETDGIEWIKTLETTIDLLYIDANGSYESIVRESSARALRPGSIVLAHNSTDHGHLPDVAQYLEFVRDPARSKTSINMMVDSHGLEVSLW